MNPIDHPEAVETEDRLSNTSGIELEPDDDFDNEELGERQADACSLEPGCESCQ